MAEITGTHTDRKAAQPFHFEGTAHSRVGVLIVHGFTGSPAEMRPLGLYLNQSGYTVNGVLLAHHGGYPDRLHNTTWRSWVDSAALELAALGGMCDRVFIAGLSLGGLIALHLAARNVAPVAGIVVMAAPAAINDARVRMLPIAKHVVRHYSPLGRVDFSDPRARAELQRRAPDIRIDFDDPRVVAEIKRRFRIPTAAIHELVRFNRRVLKELPQVRAPALFMQGRKDTTVTPNSADVLCARVGSADKRVIWYENSGHVLPIEPDKQAVFEAVEAFIRERSARGG